MLRMQDQLRHRLQMNLELHNGVAIVPIREVTCELVFPEDSGYSRISLLYRALFESLSNMIIVGPKYEGDDDWLPLDVCQRIRGHFYRGVTLNKARQVVECIIQMVSIVKVYFRS